MEELLNDLTRMEWDWSYTEFSRILGAGRTPGNPGEFMSAMHALGAAIRYITPLLLTRLIVAYRDSRKEYQ